MALPLACVGGGALALGPCKCGNSAGGWTPHTGGVAFKKIKRRKKLEICLFYKKIFFKIITDSAGRRNGATCDSTGTVCCLPRPRGLFNCGGSLDIFYKLKKKNNANVELITRVDKFEKKKNVNSIKNIIFGVRFQS